MLLATSLTKSRVLFYSPPPRAVLSGTRLCLLPLHLKPLLSLASSMFVFYLPLVISSPPVSCLFLPACPLFVSFIPLLPFLLSQAGLNHRGDHSRLSQWDFHLSLSPAWATCPPSYNSSCLWRSLPRCPLTPGKQVIGNRVVDGPGETTLSSSPEFILEVFSLSPLLTYFQSSPSTDPFLKNVC